VLGRRKQAAVVRRPRVPGAVGRRTPRSSVIGVVVLIAWCVLALAPVVITLISVFKSNEMILAEPLGIPSLSDIDFSGLQRAWEGNEFSEPAWRYGVNSIIAVTVGVGVSMALATPAAYGLARARGLMFLNRYFVLLMTVPSVVAWIPLFKLASSLEMLSSPLRLGIIYAAFALPIATILLRAQFASFPVDLVEAAKVDGASETRAFLRVVLPMSLKSMAVVAMLNAIFLWNELGVALILLLDSETRTLPVGIAGLTGQYGADAGAQYALLAISLIPILVIYTLARRRITEGMQLGALK
jgi:ABC-type glycerol-3-phosphate transport system permease component